jgi:hypothetical protein
MGNAIEAADSVVAMTKGHHVRENGRGSPVVYSEPAHLLLRQVPWGWASNVPRVAIEIAGKPMRQLSPEF